MDRQTHLPPGGKTGTSRVNRGLRLAVALVPPPMCIGGVS